MADTALEFDRPDVNVDLAKQYLKENGDKIKNMEFKKKDEKWQFKQRKAEILGEKIKENSKLICQLEYMTNNTPIEDSEKNIQLMLQYLSLSNKYRPTAMSDPNYPVAILKNTPLALVMIAIDMGVLTVCEERSAVCHLILKLCEETGLLLSTFKVNTTSGDNKDLYNAPSCTGIVAERSDLDSAVDAFLSSSSSPYCFWRLRRIFVQESIFQSFKELIEFKAKLKGTKTKEQENMKSLSSDLFVYEDKLLLFDYAGDDDGLRSMTAHVILIEAYRTNKELLTLVGEKARDDCVSLWCADVAEANEIAYSVPASLVWINDYGNFDGPPEMSTFFLNFLSSNFYNEYDVPKRIFDSYETWKKYDRKKRVSIIYNVLEKVKEASSLSEEGDTKNNILKLLEQISNFKFSAVEVAGGKLCVTVDSLVGLHFDEITELDANVFGSLVIGNGVVCRYFAGQNNASVSLLRDLECAGVPIWNVDELNSDETNKIRIPIFRYRTKVVMTNFGTIFAN